MIDRLISGLSKLITETDNRTALEAVFDITGVTIGSLAGHKVEPGKRTWVSPLKPASSHRAYRHDMDDRG